MSDYFAHLAAAARGTVGEVRPRVPLPFEPPPCASTAEPDAAFAAEFVEEAAWEERRDMPAAAEAPMLRPPETPSPPAVAAPRALPGAPTAAAPSLPSPTPESVLMVGGVGPEPTAVTPGTKVPGSRSRDETPLPRPSRPQIEPAAAPRREPVALARTAVVSPTEASPGASIAPAAPRLPPIPPRRERLRSDLGLARAATPPAETTIHVSIGRIEVRAAATVPVREPRRVASPVMSLEEYLRARAGRARS